ncbi:hypothetical protein K469DRAFT_722971 [Zopfia rhizophila CBS 207.26]|uniref:MFS general substrate transporter n=1 Tax=Zopfia rhizophila CBS 207.26 TaxID=1314779 RepID=A0A6A6EEV1_9PEZI|nr:hypothetical protein K469DRAFT_722971 [Zopfia rhizophila CBS 207.26]
MSSVVPIPRNGPHWYCWKTGSRAGTSSHLQRTHPPFFSNILFQNLVVGICAICAPGIWSAMNGLGVGGSQCRDLVNAANAILYGFMTIACFAGPWLANLIGFRYTLAVGSLGYPIYAAGLCVNNRFGETWFVYVGAVACGISARFFWSVEGAVATGYLEQHKRGRYIAAWFTFRNFGDILGGAVSLGIKPHNINQRSKVGYQTYPGFIAIQCLGFFLGLLLSNPERVVCGDGTKIQAPRGIKWRTEGREMLRLVRSKSILLLAPLIWDVGWIQVYPGTALGVFMSAVVGTFVTWLGGSLADVPWAKSRQTRGIDTYNEYRHTRSVLDWGNQRTFGRRFGVYMFERIRLAMVANYMYWCIGGLSDSRGSQILYSSLLTGIETAGVAVTSINCGLWFFALPLSNYATLRLVRKFNKLDKEREEALERA